MATPRQVGPYLLHECLGAGGMGEVFRATDPRLGRAVAVKVVPQAADPGGEVAARFEREARAVAALSHPNIVVIHDFGSDRGLHYAVTELLAGETLAHRLTLGPLPWREAAGIAAAVAEGLQAAHARGIVHRDLKPANLFLTDAGVLKILDFGIARLATPDLGAGAPLDTTQPGMVMGSVGYMAPEQVAAAEVDGRSDLFSLGCVLYEMLAGVRAFAGGSAVASMVAIMRDEPPSLREIAPGTPPELAHIVERCLAKEPGGRYQTAGELALALRVLTTAPTGMRPAVEAAQAAPAARRRLRSLAVLPFHNASSDANTEYLSDGVTENLIRTLSQWPQLRVMARSTVFRFKEAAADPLAAGRQLGVEAVLVGRLRERGGQLLVSAELVEVASGSHLWGEQYSRPLHDLFALEADLARSIAEHLRARLGDQVSPAPAAEARRPTTDGEAYKLYLRGRYVWNQRTEEGLRQARAFFEEAIERDPSFALAWAGLADAHNVLPFWGLQPPRLAFVRAKQAATRALELEAELAEAHAALAYARFYYDWDWPAAAAGFQHALRLNPSYATAHHGFGVALALVGQRGRALEALARAQELDPLSLIIQADIGLVAWLYGDFEQTLVQCRAVLALDRDFAPAHHYQGLALEQLGRPREALAAFAEAFAATGYSSTLALAAIGHAAARAGELDQARAVLDRLDALWRERYVSEYPVAVVHAALGEQRLAFAWLQRGCESRCEAMVWLLRDPRLAALAGDERMAEIRRRLGGLAIVDAEQPPTLAGARRPDLSAAER